MALSPAARFTRKQIVDRALRRAGNTQLANGPEFEAQLWLNQILFDIYTLYDWPMLQTTVAMTLNADITLPTDFAKTLDDNALVINTIDSSPVYRVIQQVDRETYDRVKGPGTATGQPMVWFCDLNTSTGRIWPLASGQSVSGTLRYQSLPADIAIDLTGDSVIPTFPWHDFLIQALYTYTLEYENDGRAQAEVQKREAFLAKILKAAHPSRSGPSTIPLDPQVFSQPFSDDWYNRTW